MVTVEDPDLELGGVLIYLTCRPFSLQSFLRFLPEIKGPWAPPLDLPLGQNNSKCRDGVPLTRLEELLLKVKRKTVIMQPLGLLRVFTLISNRSVARGKKMRQTGNIINNTKATDARIITNCKQIFENCKPLFCCAGRRREDCSLFCLSQQKMNVCCLLRKTFIKQAGRWVM